MNLGARLRTLENRCARGGLKNACPGCGWIKGYGVHAVCNLGEEDDLPRCPICTCWIREDGRPIEKLIVLGPSDLGHVPLPEFIQEMDEREALGRRPDAEARQ